MATSSVALRENGNHGTAIPAAVLEKTLIVGDLSQLTPSERVSYYLKTCETLGLNPLTKPFEYLALNGKLVLYANKNCADQLRGRDKVDLRIVAREFVEDVYVVTARATLPDGRSDESIGAVAIGKNVVGDARANAIMKAETKAKRRVTLSIVGLGFIDESEIETIDGARRVQVDHETGEITEDTRPAPKPVAAPKKSPTDAEIEKLYRELCDKADVVGVSAEEFNPAWSREEKIQRGKDLRARIAAKEALMATPEPSDLFEEPS